MNVILSISIPPTTAIDLRIQDTFLAIHFSLSLFIGVVVVSDPSVECLRHLITLREQINKLFQLKFLGDLQTTFVFHRQLDVGAGLKKETSRGQVVEDDRQVKRCGVLLISLIEIQIWIEFQEQLKEIDTLKSRTQMRETIAGLSNGIDV